MQKEELLPIVSVVTLVYKNYMGLKDTIRSVLRQDYRNIEYFISDDGSADFPYEEISALIKEENVNHFNVSILNNTENKGTVKHMNAVYKDCFGEYYINLSAGDIFYDNRVVSSIVNKFLKSNCDVLVTSRIFYEGILNPICYLPHMKERKIIDKINSKPKGLYKAFIQGEFYDAASGSAMHYSRRIMKEMDYFDESYKLWEDGPFIAKYAYNHKIETAYDIVSVLYQKGGISTQKGPKSSALLEDDKKFNTTERVTHLEDFDATEKKRILYRIERKQANTSKKKIRAYIRYFPQVVHFMLYSMRRKIYCKHDQKYLQQVNINTFFKE